MKKIIALILALCCVFAIVSCDGGEEQTSGVAEFERLYSASEPTKVVTNQTTAIGNVFLKGSSILVTGALNNGDVATVYTESYETLQSVQSGAGDVITPIMGEPITSSREYVEGKGVRYDGGAWDETGLNFAPKAGSIAINLDETKLKDCIYNDSGDVKTLTFTVEAKNASSVFGEWASEITSDVSVIITANVAVVTGITVSYTEDIVSDDEDIEYPAANITISTVYTYDVEEITLVK